MATKKSSGKPHKKIHPNEEKLQYGISIIKSHPLFFQLYKQIIIHDKILMGKDCAAYVDSSGYIYLNKDIFLTESQWAYAIAHCELHLAFGHFDADRMPGYTTEQPDGTLIKTPSFNKYIWNAACNIYIAKFLHDIGSFTPICPDPVTSFPGSLTDELKIYDYLMEHKAPESDQRYGTAGAGRLDMRGLERPLVYNKNLNNRYTSCLPMLLHIPFLMPSARQADTTKLPPTRIPISPGRPDGLSTIIRCWAGLPLPFVLLRITAIVSEMKSRLQP